MAISNIFVSLLSLLALAVIPSPAEARANTVCALSSDGARVIRWDGNSWQKIGDAAGTLYGGGFALVATNPENSKVFAWAPNNGWQEIGGGGSQFVVTTSAIFGLNPRRDSVHKWAYEGTRWDQIGGPASAIYGGGGGGNDLYATSPGNTEVWRYGQAGTWDKVGGGGAQFAVDGNRVLYGLTGNRDAVYQYTGSGENWNQIGGPASRIFAGGFGMFAVNPSNTEIWRHNSGSGWEKVGGGGKEFAVSDEGLYGLDSPGSRVYKWNFGENWNDINGGNIKQIVPCP